MRILCSAAVAAVLATVTAFSSAPAVAEVPAKAEVLSIPAGEYALDPAHASLFWRVRHLGLSNYTARLAAFSATVTLDPANVTGSSVAATIDPKSVKTEFPYPEKENFDKTISEKFLKSGQYPTISFRSTSLVATGPKSGRLTGDLTFLGVTKPVTLDLKLVGLGVHPMTKKPAFGVSAHGVFKRSDFGSTDLSGVIGDDVEIMIDGEFQKK